MSVFCVYFQAIAVEKISEICPLSCHHFPSIFVFLRVMLPRVSSCFLVSLVHHRFHDGIVGRLNHKVNVVFPPFFRSLSLSTSACFIPLLSTHLFLLEKLKFLLVMFRIYMLSSVFIPEFFKKMALFACPSAHRN